MVVMKRNAKLFEMIGAFQPSRGRASLLHRGNYKGKQNANNRQCDEQLNQGNCTAQTIHRSGSRLFTRGDSRPTYGKHYFTQPAVIDKHTQLRAKRARLKDFQETFNVPNARGKVVQSLQTEAASLASAH